MLNANYENWFYFQNNEVSGLVISERRIGYYNNEDIIPIFFNYKENVKKPEETFGLFPVFVLSYTYNILTKEIVFSLIF